MRHLIIFSLIVVLLAACAPASSPASPDEPVTLGPSESPVSQPANTPPAGPYSPQPGDQTLTRSSVFLNSADLLTLESFPVQIMLFLRGELPTPCHSLRAVMHIPDENNNIEIELYSLVDPNTVCVQVLQSFEANVPLGSFPSGHYTVSVNGQKVGEFNS